MVASETGGQARDLEVGSPSQNSFMQVYTNLAVPYMLYALAIYSIQCTCPQTAPVFRMATGAPRSNARRGQTCLTALPVPYV